ncbi:MAG: hypothetical protein F6K24_15390 [Okeania sp. SIO2D1]|nr:hypothetical protein [Okeania sp. SIO2D1]
MSILYKTHLVSLHAVCAFSCGLQVESSLVGQVTGLVKSGDSEIEWGKKVEKCSHLPSPHK